MRSHLELASPAVAERLSRIELVARPTPVDNGIVRLGSRMLPVAVKCDNESSSFYGGNKVRKLEYLLQRARRRGATRIATFGAVASNHATATSLFAKREGFRCIAFLSHQTKTAAAARALNMHLALGTEVVAFRGNRRARVAMLREHLRGETTWVIPLGGTSWLGALGFVDAALELAAQIAVGETEVPDELYVACGTMGTVAGLALGLALAGLDTRVNAIRVTAEETANPQMLERLLDKTALLLNRMDPAIPRDLGRRTNIAFRTEFFGDGYAKTNPETDAAVAVAREQLGLTLEATYTGKAFRALIEDCPASRRVLFWNTYNSVPLPVGAERPDDVSALPETFLSYFD